MADEVVVPAPAAGEPAVEEAVTTTWRDSLPEPLKAATTLTKFKTVDDLANGYVNLEKHAGSAVKIPGADATADERKAFFARLGVPETPDGYGVEAKVPDGMPWDKSAEKLFLQKMHGHGLTKPQAQGILDDYLTLMHQGHVAQAQAKAQSADEAYGVISQDWGGLTDQNLALVQRSVAEFGGDDLKQYLDDSGLGNDPRFLKFVHTMAVPLLEAGHVSGENLGMSRADAKVELAKIMAMPEYLDPMKNKALVEKTRALSALAYGGDDQ